MVRKTPIGEHVGWVWMSKNSNALIIAFKDDKGRINDESKQYVVFMDGLAQVIEGSRKSASMFKSVPLKALDIHNIPSESAVQ